VKACGKLPPSCSPVEIRSPRRTAECFSVGLHLLNVSTASSSRPAAGLASDVQNVQIENVAHRRRAASGGGALGLVPVNQAVGDELLSIAAR